MTCPHCPRSASTGLNRCACGCVFIAFADAHPARATLVISRPTGGRLYRDWLRGLVGEIREVSR